MSEKQDLELVDEFKKGSVDGFNELVRRYQEKVYWIARRVVGSHDDADDVVQEVFIRVHHSLTRFRADSSFFTWIYRITTNVALNALRKKRLKQSLTLGSVTEQMAENQGNPEDTLAEAAYIEALEKAIDRLPPKQKMVFVLRYYEEMPYSEMATLLRKSEGGLKANYSHALRKIQEFVRKELEL